MSKARGCEAKTKAGKACKSPAIKGLGLCISHAPRVEQAKMGFGGAENGAKGGEARRVPKLTEVLRERVEERADEIMDKLFSMLDADRAVVVGNGPGAHVETVPDHELALKAIREIYDRFEGRPKQATEITGAGGGPIQTAPVLPDDPEWEQAIAAIQAAHVPALNGSNGNGNGNGSH